jgi:predicted GTPase
MPEKCSAILEAQEISGEALISLGNLDDNTRIQQLLSFGFPGGPAIKLSESIKQLSEKVQAERRHIMIFGTTGAGKTTLLNNLTGQNYRTGNGLEGVTFETTKYPVMSRNGVEYIFYDTIGLNGPSPVYPSSEKTSGANSIRELTDLLITHKKGLHLVVLVLQKKTNCSNGCEL